MSFRNDLRRSLPSRRLRPRRSPLAARGRTRRRGGWQRTRRCRSRAPRWPRRVAGGEIVVVGGFVATAANSARADAYSIARERLAPAADLPRRGRPRRVGERERQRLRRRRLRRATAARSRPPSCSGGTRAGARLRSPARRPRRGRGGDRRRPALRRRRRRRQARPRQGRVRARPRDAALGARPRPDAARAPAAAAAGTDASTRSAAAAPASTRTRGRFEVYDARTRRWTRLRADPAAARRHRRGVRRRPHRLDRRRAAAGDDRERLRLRPAARAAGSGSRTCPRRGTGSASSRTRGRVYASPAGRSPA